MARASTKSSAQIAEVERQLDLLRARQQRDRRALDVLYKISMACQGHISFRPIFEATHRELSALFPFDSCLIARADERPGRLDAALLALPGGGEFAERLGHGPLIGLLLGQRQPLLFRDLAAERADLDRPPDALADGGQPARAWMGVPLLVGELAVGVIALQSSQPGAYDAADLDLLQRVGNVVAVALENASLAQKQRDLSRELADQVAARTRELHTLGALADEMVLQRPLPNLLDRALGLVAPLFGADAASVRLLDAQRDELVLVAQHGIPEAYRRAARVVSVAGSPLSRVVLDGQPLVVGGGLAALPRLGAPPPFEALLAVPLQIGARVVGALNLFVRQPRSFSEQQIDLAQVIGNQIAIAVENGRLLEERERQIAELRALSDISRATSTALDLPELLRQVHESLRGFIRLDAFVMIVYDPERQVVAEGLGIDVGQEYTYLPNNPPPPASLTAWVIHHRRPLHFRNMAEEIAAYPELRQILIGVAQPSASWLGVPLFDRAEQVIGVICVQGYTPHAFSARDEGFLIEVARHVALHVQNVRLLTQRERQIRELDAIGRIGQLASASYDLDAMLEGVYQTLDEVTSASVFYLLICEPDTRVITNAVFVEQGERIALDWSGQPPTPGSMSAWIIGQREPLIFQDVPRQRDQLLARGIRPRPLGPDNPVRSWVGVPLLAKDGEPIGVLAVQDYRAYRYDDQTIDFLSQVATHISLAVQKVRLFEERQRQLEENARLFAEAQAHAAAAERQAHRMGLVHRISLVLSSRLDQQEVLDLAAREVVRLFEVDHSSIVLFDEHMREAVIVAEFPPSGVAGTRLTVADNPIVAELIATGRPVSMPSVATDERAAALPDRPRALGLVSLTVVPLMSRGRVIGSLGLDSLSAPRAFDADEQDLQLTVAASIAAAVENARLFAAEQDARRTADTLREVARVLSSSFNPGVVLQLILGELQRVIPYDTGSIMLIEGRLLRIAAMRDRQEIAIPHQLTIPIEQRGGARRVIQRRQPVVIADTLVSPDWTAAEDDISIRSWLGVPLIAKGALLGVLNINAGTPGRFSERDAEVALAFANHAAVAMENARLYQESVTRVEQELEIARQIQSNLFPRALPQVPGLELAALCLPARETGGDFYDVVRLSEQAEDQAGPRLAIMVGDVSGKSIPAAMLMAVARSIARSEARDHETPEAVIRETNRWIVLDVPPRAFVAFSYATLDLRRRRLALANAGQLAPLRRRADGAVEYLEVRGPTLPLGIRDDVAYVALEVDLAPGDVLVFYTDGIVEAQNHERALFGFERLEALLRDYGGGPPQELIDRLMAAIGEFIGAAAPHDDMTLVVLRIA